MAMVPMAATQASAQLLWRLAAAAEHSEPTVWLVAAVAAVAAHLAALAVWAELAQRAKVTAVAPLPPLVGNDDGRSRDEI